MAESDFKSIYDDMAPAQAPPAQAPPMQSAPQDPMQQLGAFGANLGVQSQMNEDPRRGSRKSRLTLTATCRRKFHKDVYEALMRDHQQLNEIRGSFHQEAERLRQRQEQMQTPGGAIGSAFSRLAGNLAMQKDMPGWVRGLGMTAAQLNPTQEELSQERQGVLGREAAVTEQGLRGSEGMMRALDMGERANATLEQKKAEARAKAQDAFIRSHEQAARINQVAPDHDTFVDRAVKSNRFTKEEAEAAFADLEKTAGSTAQRWQQKEEAKAAIKTTADEKIARLRDELGTERDVKKHGLKLQELAAQYALKKDLAATQSEIRTAETGQKEALKLDSSFAKISPKDTDRLAAFDTTERYVDWFKEWVHGKQAEGVIGPLANYTIGQLPQYMKPEERVKFESMITHETPRMLQMISSGQPGGFSMLRFKGSLELLQKMGISAPLRLDQMDGIFGVLYDANSQQRKGVMDAYPRARWDYLPSLLGRDADYRPKGWKPLTGQAEGGTSPAAKPPSGSKGTKDHGPAPQGAKDGQTGNNGKYVVRNGRWVDNG